MRWRDLAAAIAVCAFAASAAAQSRADSRSLETLLKNRPPGKDDARTVNANIPELVTIRLAQLEEDRNFTQGPLPLWNA
jgi:hypothetical protein